MILIKIAAFIVVLAMLAFIAGLAYMSITEANKPRRNSIIRRHYTDKI